MVSEKLGLLPGFGALANASSLVQLAVLWLVAPFGYIYLLRPAIEGRFLLPPDEWLAFWFDSLLAAAIVCGGMIAQRTTVRLAIPGPLWLRVAIHLVVVGVFLLVAWQHISAESKQFTPGMRRSPTAIYHTLLYPFLGYLLVFMVLVPVLLAGWRSLQNVGLSLVAVACVTAYLWAVFVYDQHHKHNPQGVHKSKLAHVDNWQPWVHHYQDFWPSLKRLGEWLWQTVLP